VPLKLGEIIDLDNGTAYLGFVQETRNLANVTLIENWSFHSNVKSNQRDPWSGLSLRYTCQWPLHLIFSPDMLEKYNTIYRFLLPVKRIQIDLQYVWSQKVRSMKHLIDEPVFRQAMQLRMHMSFLIDNLYSYL
jgi:gamma-tubulin complex component 4